MYSRGQNDTNYRTFVVREGLITVSLREHCIRIRCLREEQTESTNGHSDTYSIELIILFYVSYMA